MHKTQPETRHAQPDGLGEALYARYLAGDRDALRELVEAYGENLAAYLCRIVGNRDDAQELMIETFGRLILSGTKFAGKSSFKTYLFAIGKHIALRHARRHRHSRSISFEKIVQMVDNQQISPETSMLLAERKEHLTAAISALKVEYREILHLLYFEEMSYAEAGEILHKTVKQIDNLAYRAKEALKKKLESEGFTYALE